MFMVKEEFKNIKNLFRVRLKMAKNQYIVFALIFTGFLLIPLINNILYIISNNTNLYIDVPELSGFILFGFVIGLVVSVIIYRTANAKLSVYPQTNNSRLISSLLMTYLTITLVWVVISVMHLINLGTFKLMSVFYDNIIFALNIDIEFIIAGFFVYIAYSFLIVSAIEFIGAILRKWTYYAAVALTTLFALLIVNLPRIIGQLSRIFAFLIAEPSLLLFFLKAAGLWLAITAATLLLNRYTVFYKSRSPALKRGTVIICIVIAVAIIAITPAVIFEVSYSNSDDYWEEADWIIDENDYINTEEFTFDISHLPDGSRIDIAGTNIHIWYPGQWVWSSDEAFAIVSIADELYNIQGDTITVGYRPAWYLVNGIEVYKYTNQHLSVHLEGNTLILDYTRDNVHVLIMPVWSLARQFDYFKDMGLFTTNALGFTSGGNSRANIWINVE
ncbi:MAG: DUF6185 family protein [Oscillospiraceae bacterium]|nr:DUF6185 family protein [Oscillospiraceae bacterium]